VTARRSPVAAPSQRGRVAFTRAWHAYEIQLSQDRTCRVCRGTMLASMTVLFRAWGVEFAHRTCGWLRPEEYEPHECRGASAPHAWEWACPTCKRDVVRREVAIDRRCVGCQVEEDT
jgi:hypothetical protein